MLVSFWKESGTCLYLSRKNLGDRKLDLRKGVDGEVRWGCVRLKLVRRLALHSR